MCIPKMPKAPSLPPPPPPPPAPPPPRPERSQPIPPPAQEQAAKEKVEKRMGVSNNATNLRRSFTSTGIERRRAPSAVLGASGGRPKSLLDTAKNILG